MQQTRIGDQVIRYDPAGTQRIYDRIQRGDADECGCTSCQNFAAQRNTAFPPYFRSLLSTLGIDTRKEGEVYECGPRDDGNYIYGGWFYFCGVLVEAGQRSERATDDNNFEFWFTSSCPASTAFSGVPYIAVEFLTSIPWIRPAE